MDARAILMRLRDGEALSAAELTEFALGLADGRVSDAQAGAFAMAVLLNGLGKEGRVALTLAMRDSGDVLEWKLDRPVLDKHSTGGVGDCVSLILAPALAVCGAAVPMISGRGLGHTGGTLDKLESIPGVSPDFDGEALHRIVRDTGCAIVSASKHIAPADKRLYAVRDVTGTVESLDLITASILSKKLAAGLEGLVLDVKTGSGAFMKHKAQAIDLAQSLVSTANAAGCPTTALITDMSQPLAPNMGNALEVASAMRVLTGEAQGRLFEVSLALGEALLHGAGLFETETAARKALQSSVADGRAAECFGRMIAAQGGPADFLDRWEMLLPRAPVCIAVKAGRKGYLSGWDGTALGMTVVDLGGGRHVETDQVDPRVGLSNVAPIGTTVEAGDPIAWVHACSDNQAAQAAAAVLGAVHITDDAVDVPDLVQERIV